MQQGFFNRSEIEVIPSKTKGKELSCEGCGLYASCKSPKIKPYGNFAKGILNIGSVPTSREDQKGLPFQGREGAHLTRTYKKCGVDLFEDCLNVYAIQCYTEVEPTQYQIDCCALRLKKIIEHYKPKVIVVFGQIALNSVIGSRWKKNLGSLTKWRGWMIPDQEYKAWICPVFDPETIVNSDKGIEEITWLKDLQQALPLIREPFPIYKEPKIDYIEDLSVLKKIKKEFAFDYETTGLKPHAKKHRVICCAIADNEDHAYAFMMPQTKSAMQPFLDLLEDESIGKIAQNLKFEHVWSSVRLRTTVNNWVWDTMLASHILDNRAEITGLKFQTYVQFGVIDYDSEVSPYLKAKDTAGSNSINNIFSLIDDINGVRTLLKYCALDAVFELRLANKQRELICLPF